MYEIQDGLRTVRFEGELLSTSSSRDTDKDRDKKRWIEFKLYKTARGNYILSRIGMSLLYHQSACFVVEHNGILPVPTENLSLNMVPCKECRPNKKVDLELYPETPRYWMQKFDADGGAAGLVASFEREDNYGALYFTNVSKRLLEEAAKKDDDIHSAYYNEWVE